MNNQSCNLLSSYKKVTNWTLGGLKGGDNFWKSKINKAEAEKKNKLWKFKGEVAFVLKY